MEFHHLVLKLILVEDFKNASIMKEVGALDWLLIRTFAILKFNSVTY